MGVVHCLGDLRFQVEAKLFELGVDRLGGAAVLVDGRDPALEVDTRLDGAEDLVDGPEHT